MCAVAVTIALEAALVNEVISQSYHCGGTSNAVVSLYLSQWTTADISRCSFCEWHLFVFDPLCEWMSNFLHVCTQFLTRCYIFLMFFWCAKLFCFRPQSYLSRYFWGLEPCEDVCRATGPTTHSVTVLEDFSRLKASWYFRLSTSFFIWGRSISSMAAARCRAFLPERSGEARVIFTQYITLLNSRQTHSIHLCPAARTPPSTSDL